MPTPCNSKAVVTLSWLAISVLCQTLFSELVFPKCSTGADIQQVCHGCVSNRRQGGSAIILCTIHWQHWSRAAIHVICTCAYKDLWPNVYCYCCWTVVVYQCAVRRCWLQPGRVVVAVHFTADSASCWVRKYQLWFEENGETTAKHPVIQSVGVVPAYWRSKCGATSSSVCRYSSAAWISQPA